MIEDLKKILNTALDDCTFDELISLSAFLGQYRVDLEERLIDLSQDRVEKCPGCNGEGGFNMTQEEANAVMCAPGWHDCELCGGKGTI